MTLLMEEMQAGGPSGKLYRESLVNSLAIRFILCGNSSDQTELYSPVSKLPLPTLKRVLDLIEEKLASDITLTALAAEAGYSRGHFVKMFYKATGMTPHRYILNRRVEHARFLLKRKNARLVDVAVSCGFSSQAHLTKIFREYAGVTPAEYRRRL
jgi:AraC family transcriptional regulator